MNLNVYEIVFTIIASVLASSGLWAFIFKRLDRKDVKGEMLRGLAHDRITYLGLYYIKKGSITKDEFENLNDYLYIPYEKLGGNGSAQRVMEEVRKLPIKIPDKKTSN